MATVIDELMITMGLDGSDVKKGMKVTVVGRLTYNEYEKDGVKRTSAEIIANELVLHGDKKSEGIATAPVTEAPITYASDLPF